jgi:Rad3-related DNA helicase
MEIINFLQNFILAVKGRTLVLFTAFYMIKEVYSKLFLPLNKNNINIYAQ